jgi:cobalt-zinc-cadmium efflux system outer membrane protein
MRTHFIFPILAVACAALPALAQTPLTWDQVKARFEATNPTLRAGDLNISESKASEITAFLRPNPNMTFSMDQFQFFNGNPYRPFGFLLPFVAFDYLHERGHKRELRLESAQEATAIAESQQLDLQRTMLFTLRSAFVQTLQAKQLLIQAQENLDYFNKELAIFRSRFQSGDIARVDFDRMLMQRPQYESDYQNALVNSRTARITMRMLLNDQTPVDKFDVAGLFEFKERVLPLEEFHSAAEAARPDLKAAIQAVNKAHTEYKLAVANGSTDPTFGVDFARNPPIPVYMGFSVSIPLRIFDRNQGEKARTRVDITHAEREKDAARAQVFSDVDSAYVTLVSSINLLKPYQGPDGYLLTATRIRDTMSFSYLRGQAALVDYLDAQRDYRAIEVAYINLVAAYLNAASQLNMAVGREVLQ